MLKKRYREYLLAAVVKNTVTDIAVFGITKDNYDIIFHLDYDTSRINNLSELLIKTMDVAKENANIKLTKACIAAAGPVSRSREHVKLIKSDLKINKTDIMTRTGLKTLYLLNDYEAMAYGIDLVNKQTEIIKLPHIKEELVPKSTDERTIAIIGSECGLGMSLASYDFGKKMHAAMPSDGGHIDIIAKGKLEADFLNYLSKKYKIKPGYEAVLSEDGIFTLFDFLLKQGYKTKQKAAVLKDLSDAVRLEAIQTHYHTDSACKKTMQMFIIFYARMCKILALVSQSYSGLYITDMLVLKNIKDSEKNQLLKLFMQEFEASPTRADMLRKIPVFLLTSKKTGLVGCYNYVVTFR